MGRPAAPAVEAMMQGPLTARQVGYPSTASDGLAAELPADLLAGMPIDAPNGQSGALTFRTDSGPELDWYQPCDGGDNNINFEIDVTGVDLNAVRSATLRLAVWDVDFNCSLSTCERDEVYLNGTQLTTPQMYLTGANDQWSTVTFEVDPALLQDGANRIDIEIDVLDGGWCVECDWGELTLEMDAVDLAVESRDIQVESTSWWEFWKQDFDISATVHNEGSVDAQDVAVKFIRMRDGKQLQTETQTIALIEAGDEQTVTIDWNLSPRDDVKVIVDPGDDIGEFDETNNDAVTTRIRGTLTNEDGQALPYTLVNLQAESGGQGWDGLAWTFTDVSGDYSILANYLQDGDPFRIAAEMVYSPSADLDNPIFKFIDDDDWVARRPSSSDVVTVESPAGELDFNKVPSAIDISVSNNDGGMYLPALHKSYQYFEGLGYAPSDLTYVEINEQDETTNYQWRDAIHMIPPTAPGGEASPSKLVSSAAHEYTHRVMDGWGAYQFYNTMSEPAANWGGAVSLGTSVYRTWYDQDIDLMNMNNTGVFQLASVFHQLTHGTASASDDIVWDTLRDDVDSSLVVDFYTHYIARDIRPSTTIKGIFQANGYMPMSEGWPGKNGEDPDFFTGNYTDEARDTDADGTMDTLAVTVELDIPSDGVYRLGGELGELSRSAATTVNLTAGIHQVELRFDGTDVFMAGHTGPYTFSGFLYNEAFELVDFRIDSYTTGAHDPADFQAPDLYYTGTHSDQGVDSDGDGQFDALVVEAEVNVSMPGQYQVYGNLYHGEDTIWAAGDGDSIIVDLAAGLQTIEYTFDGQAIAGAGIDGPYTYALSVPAATDIPTNAYTATQFAAPPAALSGTLTDAGEDEDGDGLFDWLVVDPGLDVTGAGTYWASAYLYDADGLHIATSFAGGEFDVGTSPLPIYFDGLTIREEAVDGPYDVQVELFSDQGVRIGMAAQTTGPYDHTQFQLAPDQQLQWTIVDAAVDPDTNGLFDELQFDVDLSSPIRTGQHRFEAYLLDANDQVVAFSDQTTTLGAAPADLMFTFDGQPISANGVDGPFTLDVRVFDATDTLVVDLPELHTTASYAAADFEGAAAMINGTYDDAGSDADADGLFDQLIVDIGVDVNDAGDYRLSGRLVDEAGNEIGVAFNTVSLPVGSSTVPLTFDGETIYRSLTDGPYELVELQLTDLDGALIHQVGQAHATDPYAYQAFEGPEVLLTGAYDDYGVDTNGDGYFDNLTVEIGVAVQHAGAYDINARLMDAAGQEIVWSATNVNFNANEARNVTLVFDGDDIVAHGANGPYTVRDLYVYRQANPAHEDHAFVAHTTGFYGVGDFTPMQDLDAMLDLQWGHVSFDRRTGNCTSILTVTNTSANTIVSPARLVLQSISNPNVVLANQDATTPGGSPYLCLSCQMPAGQLDPGASMAVPVVFGNPLKLRFSSVMHAEGQIA